MLKDQKIKNFLDTLASKAATPGGGSVAALVGAMGSALLSMVANLTLGKEKYQHLEADIRILLEKTERLRSEFEVLMERDVEAFNQFMAIVKLPKETKEQKQTRKEKVQIALVEAANVPLEVAKKSQKLLTICSEISQKGNKNVISDAGVGVILAEAAIESAILNVKCNLAMIQDEKIKENLSREINKLSESNKEEKEKVIKIVLERIK